MLILIAGGEYEARLTVRRKRAPGALEELDRGMSAEELATLASTPTLTGEIHTFLLRDALGAKPAEGTEGEAISEAFPELARGLAESPHLFLFEEEKAPVRAALEALKQSGATVELLATPKKKEVFNVFDLANALARRDKKTLWLGLVRALRAGLAPENIAGVLAWKARSQIALAEGAGERHSAILLSRRIVCLYHDAHRGQGDLALLLERFALSL